MFYILNRPHNPADPYEKIESSDLEGDIDFYMRKCKDSGYILYGPFKDIEECNKGLDKLESDLIR